MELRLAKPEDSPALLKIYAQYMDTPITFETVLPTEREFTDRMLEILQFYPYLVCCDGADILGYAYAHRQHERAAYQWNVECSIYVDRAYLSQGIGKRMYRALLTLLKLQGVKTAYGCITLPNEKSVRFHETLGFVRLGVCHCTGYKCGRWHDVAWYEKSISSYEPNPPPVRPLCRLERETVEAVFNPCE